MHTSEPFFDIENLKRKVNGTNNNMITYQQLVEQRQAHIEALRAFVKSQKELWLQVPDWAFKANGRTGYSDGLTRASQQKLWAIPSSANKHVCGYTVFVNLTTGELVNSSDRQRPASDEDLLACRLQDLNAEVLLASLKQQAKVPFYDKRFETEYKQRMQTRQTSSHGQ